MALLSLIEEIGACGVDAARWPSTLARIAEMFGGPAASLNEVGPRHPPWMIDPCTDPQFSRSYVEHYHELNPFYVRFLGYGPHEPVSDRMLAENDAIYRSAFYNEWALPQEFRHVLGAAVLIENGQRTSLQISRKHDFTEDDFALFRLIEPHVSRAIEVGHRLARSEGAAAAAEHLVDGIGDAALLVDGSGRLIHANAAASALFAEGVLLLTDGGLAMADAAATRNFHLLLEEARRDRAASGGHLKIARPAGSALSAVASPFRSGTLSFSVHPVTLIVISDPDAAKRRVRSILRQRFGLTEAEAALAIEIAQGDGKHAAAARRGITYATARAHLSRVFEKTGVRRQAELVRLIAQMR